MEKVKKDRKVLRMLFTKAYDKLDEKLKEPLAAETEHDLHALFKILQGRAEELFAVDERLKEMFLDDENYDVDEYVAEASSAEQYQFKWQQIKSRYEAIVTKRYVKDIDQLSECSDPACPSKPSTVKCKGKSKTSAPSVCVSCYAPKRSYHLPKIELRKFDGNLKCWLGFWGQFRKIDEDDNMDDNDKFQYLYQSTVPGSPARELVDSFPPSGANYKKAIEQLKERFARDDLLIEVYVRELLNLILAQTKQSAPFSLCQLYDKLKMQLHALETLGVTTNKYAAMLLPLVESALPEDVLRAWQRAKTRPSNDSLENLLEFVKKEVGSEERIKIACNGLNADGDEPGIKVPTAACLASVEAKKKDTCIWCDKSSHSSFECYKANKMSFEKRKDFLNKKAACFNCLKLGHASKRCRNANKCIACGSKHSVLLCPEIDMPKPKTQAEEGESSQTNTAQKFGSTTFLQTLMVNVCSGSKTVQVRAFLDNGAQKSYIREEVAKRLNLKPIGQDSLRHCLFGGITTDKETHDVFEFKVQGIDGKHEMTMTALQKKKCCGPIPRVHNSHNLLSKLKANNIVLSDCGLDSPEIDLLIGSDYSGGIRTSVSLTLEEPNLIAIKTKLGWTLQGPVRDANIANYSLTLANNIQVHDLWELEAIGINDPAEIITREKEESDAMNSFLEKVKINEEGRYEVDLPWKAFNIKLLNNKELAEKRLMSTTNKLLKLDELQSYDKVFHEWLDLEIIEKVDDVEDNSGHYLSHHPVIKESSLTSRVRPVFNASTKDKSGYSLNSLLDKGINLLVLIMNLVIQFRLRAIGITSDIKKAFLQISLKPEDRNYLKFLWWKDREMKEVIVYRHCRVVFGLTCSPFLLAATINHHLSKYEGQLKETANRLKASFYVDNCVTSLESKEETETFIREAKSIMLDAKFELRGWITAPLQNVEMTGTEEDISVLGLTWLIKEDRLKCHYDFSDKTQEKVSKRQLLSVAQKVFDPVGFSCPTMLVPKLILQKAWQREPQIQKTRESCWDIPLPDDLCEEFCSWKKHAHLLSECIVPRRLTTNSIDKCENTLHVFCDASKASYATCIFLRSEMRDEVSVQLVLAKSRVAPSRAHVTMPRLELLAALIASRLYKQVRSALEAIRFKTIFWTDSSIVLTWITSHGDWKVFVKNRVVEIRDNAQNCEWRHIAGNLNPADLPSRGCNAKTLLESKWWDGPSWLKEKSNKWPTSSVEIDTEEVDKERKRNAVVSVNLDEVNSENFLTRLTHYFSKFKKIVRLLAWILRFTNNCKRGGRKGEITYDEFKKAEKKVMKLVQEQCPIDKKLKIKDKYIFVDEEGIIRLRTKLLLSGEPVDFTNPIFLQGNHIVLQRLVEDAHLRLLHAGSGVMIACIRESYWITGIRKLVRAVIAKCTICRRVNAKTVQTPLPPLPVDRIASSAVFEVSAVDLAGPLFLRGNSKVWIVLFTCAVYRAIHLELTKSLSTQSFILALRRFISRRGRVRILYSDNGTNFVGAYNLLKEIDWERVAEFSNARQIEWKFSPPSAPWWGGWWERLVRSVKDLLKKNLGKASLTYEELETLLCDCEAVINSRPLTYIADDTDHLRPLTPACFIHSMPSSEVPDLDEIDDKSLNRRLKFLQSVRRNLRARFRAEYTSMLIQKGREASKKFNLQIGDVVLIESPGKRIDWPIALVIELYEGRDGVTRVAKLKTATGEYTRAVKRLILLTSSAELPPPGACCESP